MSDLNIGVLDTYPTAAELFDLRSLAAQLYAAPIDELGAWSWMNLAEIRE